MCRMLEGSSSGDCIDDDVENYPVMRKKFRKKRKLKKIGPDGGSDGESDCEEESHSDVVTGVGEDSDDCSDANLQISAINQAITDGSIIEFLNAVENDGSCSSPMSAKSEKNMGDFEDEDDDPCDEELAELAARSACLAQFQIPRARQMHLQMQQQLQMQRAMTPNLLVSKRHASSPIKVMSTKNDLLCGAKVQQHHSQMNLMLQSNRYSEICQPGNTLLWDLLQDDKIVSKPSNFQKVHPFFNFDFSSQGQLSENLALEAERALGNLLCYTDKFIKMSFIEGCLQNLAANKTVIVSLRLLPRLLASFRDPDMNTHQVTMWAERNHKLMHHFFNNLKFYSNAHLKNQHQGLVLNQMGGLLYSHVQQIQVRLEFLSSIFSDMGSPRNFRLTLNQVDILWSSLGHDPDCADCLFAWLQGQTNAGDMHALGLNALQHLYLKKLPELRPEGISMVALGLFQQLFIKGRQELAKQALLANAVIPSGNEALDIVGMSNLWKIALRANNTDVSLAAIQYINTYYMEQQLKLESEFVSQCMNHLVQAADDLKRPGDQREHALMCVQRALMLLNTHLETFRRRYAYHLRRWALEGNAIGSHSALRSEGNGPPLRIILQPGGLPDKSILHLHTTDLVADLKAEIAKW
jgi:ubiquitin carboxyl-terminal hydrolase 34